MIAWYSTIASDGLVKCFSFSVFKILKNECAKFVKGSKKCFTTVGFGKLLDKSLKVRIRGYHESSDRYFKFLTLNGKVQAAAGYFPVQPEAVLIITFTNLQAGRIAISDHEDLFIWIPSPA